MTTMTNVNRLMCGAVLLSGLIAAPGCTSCFGGAGGMKAPSCFQNTTPCGCSPAKNIQPCAPVCTPAFDECRPTMQAPCCEPGGMSMPAGGGAPVMTVPGTFS